MSVSTQYSLKSKNDRKPTLIAPISWLQLGDRSDKITLVDNCMTLKLWSIGTPFWQKYPIEYVLGIGIPRYIPIKKIFWKKKLGMVGCGMGTAGCRLGMRLNWNYAVLGLFLSFFSPFLSPKIRTSNPNPSFFHLHVKLTPSPLPSFLPSSHHHSITPR